MAVKNAILKALVEGQITEILVKSHADNVVFNDNGTEKTLSTKLAEIITEIGTKAESGHVHDVATADANGFMSSADFTKLAGIAEGANKTIVDAALSSTSENPVQNKAVQAAIDALPTVDEMNSAISAAINALIDGAPETYNTLKELADYIAEHQDVVEGINAAIGSKLDASVFTEFQATLGTLATKSIVSESDLDAALVEKINASAEGNHSHSNKAVLDGITAEKVTAWDGAVTAQHTHANNDIIDGITAGKVSNWDAAYNHSVAAHAPVEAQENVIETVKVNGTAQTVTDKAVDLTVPVIYAQTATPANLKAGDLFLQIVE